MTNGDIRTTDHRVTLMMLGEFDELNASNKDP
jgi:hypothetical protein